MGRLEDIQEFDRQNIRKWNRFWDFLRRQHRRTEQIRRGPERYKEDVKVGVELEGERGGEFNNLQFIDLLDKEVAEQREWERRYVEAEENREFHKESQDLIDKAEEMLQRLKEKVFRNRFYGLRSQFGLTSSKVKPIVNYSEGSEDGNDSQG